MVVGVAWVSYVDRGVSTQIYSPQKVGSGCERELGITREPLAELYNELD